MYEDQKELVNLLLATNEYLRPISSTKLKSRYESPLNKKSQQKYQSNNYKADIPFDSPRIQYCDNFLRTTKSNHYNRSKELKANTFKLEVINRSQISVALRQPRTSSNHRRQCLNPLNEKKETYLSKYELISELGKGTFGVVHLAHKIGDTTNQSYAIKVYEKFKLNNNPTKFKNIRKQIGTMYNLDHPNIVKLIEDVETLTKINLVLQYGGSQSLAQYVMINHPLPIQDIHHILNQTLLAINYLHSKKIVHRDIKAQNILLGCNNKVKLIDFGFCTITNHNRKLTTVCGTPNYMAPELLKRQQYFGNYSDIWSFGILAYYISEKCFPFKAQNMKELTRIIIKGKYEFKSTTDIYLKQLITKCLRQIPTQRPSSKKLLEQQFFIAPRKMFKNNQNIEIKQQSEI